MGRLIIIFLFFVACTCKAQEPSLKPVISYEGNFSNFTVDNIGNVYVVSNSTYLKKLAPGGDSLAHFNSTQYGKISFVDATNPLKLLLYFKETSTIVILDRLLTVKQTIDLRKFNLQSIATIRLSYDNNIWLYDESETRIKKIDDKGEIVFESVDLKNVFNSAPKFETIIDDNKTLYLYDSSKGWFVFDYYGAFVKKYAFTNWKDVQIVNATLMGRNDSSFYLAKKNDFDYKIIKLPLLYGAIKTISVSNRIYILYPGKLQVFNAL